MNTAANLKLIRHELHRVRRWVRNLAEDGAMGTLCASDLRRGCALVSFVLAYRIRETTGILVQLVVNPEEDHCFLEWQEQPWAGTAGPAWIIDPTVSQFRRGRMIWRRRPEETGHWRRGRSFAWSDPRRLRKYLLRWPARQNPFSALPKQQLRELVKMFDLTDLRLLLQL